MPEEERLKEYWEKRDFSRTPEPHGGKRAQGGLNFVVHKHDASTLHYDLRLEIGGVLKSWAVPKGPSMKPGDKRLAIPTEDHPLDYIDFEGVIPEGQYGAGTVLSWDRGSFENLSKEGEREVPLEEGLEKGHLLVFLKGEKLKGGFALTRFRRGKKELWLLIKSRDEYAKSTAGPVESQPESVLTGRTIEQVAEQEKG